MKESIEGERKRPWYQDGCGFGQLSLVEHALCPLDARSSLKSNLAFDTVYRFTDPARRRQSARVTVLSPLGLSADDEFYLWGLLALTFSQPQGDSEFHATPHYCLRQLGVIDEGARRGGRQYRQFADAIERLSAITYRNDHFYDPVRAEHRKVGFGFLSYSLPLDQKSSRAWRFVWNPLFFEFVAAAGGHFRFDLATYRQLDPAARRLFLFASKVFARRETTPRLDLRHLGQSLLGYSATLSTADLKLKIEKVIARLAQVGVVLPHGKLFKKENPGVYSLMLTRGPYFARRMSAAVRPCETESPLAEPLLGIGFDAGAANRLIRQFPPAVLREWADITLAAKERYGHKFFSRSPEAYFVDNVRAAAKGQRTPPDWWHDVRKAEIAKASERAIEAFAALKPPVSDAEKLGGDSQESFERVRVELFGEFLKSGQSPAGARRGMANRFVADHAAKRKPPTDGGFSKIGSLVRSLPQKQ